MEAAVGISCCTTDATFENLFTFFVIEFQDQNISAVFELGQRLSVYCLVLLKCFEKVVWQFADTFSLTQRREFDFRNPMCA